MTAPSKGPDDGKLPNPHTKWPPESSTISGQTIEELFEQAAEQRTKQI
jgi:hypothetical protein